MARAREELEMLRSESPEKAALFGERLKKAEAKLTARASTREGRARDELDKEERRLAALEGEARKIYRRGKEVYAI